MFLLLHVCHLSPDEVDDLPLIPDFLMLVDMSKQWLEKSGGLGG